MKFDERTERILFVIIVLIGAFLRLYHLDLRPAHFDEGGGYAHGVLNILRGGIYDYNPDFHGPFLFHITALVFFLFGANDITLRITEALFGIFLILLMYPIRKEISQLSFLVVSTFLAVSPSLVYFSRFALHDSYFIFFTLATIVSFILYEKSGKKLYAYATASALAFLFTVKESTYITVGVFSSYLLLEFLYMFIKNQKKAKQKISSIRKNFIVIIICMAIFSSIFILLYTSLFRNFDNLEVAITKPITNWIHRIETGQGYYKPIEFYFDILLNNEQPILIFGILGIFSSLIVRKPIHRFLAYFAVTSIVVYLYIPYKMPNMVVNLTFPLALTSGIFFDFLVCRTSNKKLIKKSPKKYLNLLVIVLAIISTISLLYFSILANFVNYNNEPKNKLVFVQTVDDIKELLKDIEKYSFEKTGGKLVNIDISIPQTEYPLSWYLRDYKNVHFHNKKVNVPENWFGFNWEGDGIITWTSFEKKNGEKSMKISSINGSNANFWQKISLEGGKEYILEGWIKTKDIEKVGLIEKIAQIHVREDLNDAPGNIIAESQPLLGDNFWTKVEIPFFLPLEGKNEIWVSAVLGNWGKAKGEIWFDDFILKEKNGNGENLLPNGDFEFGNKLEEFNSQIIIVSENDGQVLEGRNGYKMKKYILRPTVNLAVYFREDLFL